MNQEVSFYINSISFFTLLMSYDILYKDYNE